MPLCLGSEMSSSTRSGRALVMRVARRLAVADHLRAVALELEVERQPFGDRRVVLDDQRRSCGRGAGLVVTPPPAQARAA